MATPGMAERVMQALFVHKADARVAMSGSVARRAPAAEISAAGKASSLGFQLYL